MTKQIYYFFFKKDIAYQNTGSLFFILARINYQKSLNQKNSNEA